MWSSSQALTIGSSGQGTLMIEKGGRVSNGNGQIASAAGSVGMATVTRDGSRWTNSNLYIGGSFMGPGGTGNLRVADGGVVEVANLLKIWNGGTLTIDGGSVVTQSIQNSDGGTLDFRAGSLSYMGNLTVGTGGLLGTNPTLGPNHRLTLSGTTTVDATRTLTLDGGALTTEALVLNGALVFHSGILALTGGTSSGGTGSVAVPTHGQLRARGEHPLQIVGLAGSQIVATGDLTIGTSSKVNGFYSNGTLEVGLHDVAVNDANDAVFDSAALVSLGNSEGPGRLFADKGLMLDFGGNITGVGSVVTPNNATTPLVNNGHIAGISAMRPITLRGYVKGVGTLDNVVITGTDAPGFSPATVYRGSVTYGGTLEIEIGGTTPGSFDRIIHTGTATLGGALNVSLTGGFVPKAADSFDVLDWASVTGAFATINLPALAGLEWDTSRLNSQGLLAVIAPVLTGDYNQNNVVDAADYLVWRDTMGQTGTELAADGNGNNQIDAGDYDVWRSHFGQTKGVAAASSNHAAVPEPATMLLLAVVGVLSVAFASRRVHRDAAAQ
jgi:T5SS/PEP-CTERM-associated repeat protein